MIIQTPWTARTFTFDQPIGVLPCIIERLRGTPVRVEKLIAGFPDDVLGRQPKPGTWSVKEHIGHLDDLDAVHSGRVDDFLAHLPVLRPADITNRRTTEAGYNSRMAPTIVEAFRRTRLALVERMERLTEDEAGLVSEHPRLKQPMRMVDMAFFVAEHDDYHLAVIRALLRNY